MNGEEEVLVGGGADHVGDEPELEGEEGRIAEVPCAGDLEGDDADDDVLCEGLGAAELGDLERWWWLVESWVWDCEGIAPRDGP